MKSIIAGLILNVTMLLLFVSIPHCQNKKSWGFLYALTADRPMRTLTIIIFRYAYHKLTFTAQSQVNNW